MVLVLGVAACGGGAVGGGDSGADSDGTSGDVVADVSDAGGDGGADVPGPKDVDASELPDGEADADAGPDADADGDATTDGEGSPDADADALPDGDSAEEVDPPSLTFVSTPVEFALAGFEWKYRPRVNAGGEPSLQLLEAPVGMVLTGQLLSWSPTAQQSGMHTMRLRATADGLSSTQVAKIQVGAATTLAQTVVGVDGGSAAITGSADGYQGASASIAAGSVSEPILLRLSSLNVDLHPAALAPGKLTPLVLGPAGVSFSESALVQVPIDPDATGQLSNLSVYVMSEASGCWTSAQIASVDQANGLAAVPMGHFSIAVAGVNAWTLDQTLVDTSAGETCARPIATTAVLSASLDALPTSAVALFEPPGGITNLAAGALLPGISGSFRHIQVADLLVAASSTASVGMSNLAVTLVLPGDGSARVVIADQDGAVLQKRAFASVADSWATDIEPMMRGLGLVHRFDKPQSPDLRVRVRSYLRYDSGNSSSAPFAPMEQGTLLAESTFGPLVAPAATATVDSDCDGVGEAFDTVTMIGQPEILKSPQDTLSVLVGNALALMCTASSPPGAAALTFQWKSSVAADLFEPAGAAVQFTASSSGTRSVTCSTTWEGTTLSRVFTVVAQAANAANTRPTCMPTADAKLLLVGGSTGLVANAVDPDGDTALKVEWGVLNAGGEFGGSPFLSAFGGPSTLFGPVTAAGTYKVACRASDAGGQGPHGVVEVQVLPAASNLPPSLALLSPAGATVAAGEALTLTASAKDSDALTFSWSPTAFVTAGSDDGAKGSATFVSAVPGLYSVFVSIGDGTNPPVLLKSVVLVTGSPLGFDADGDGFFSAGVPLDCNDGDPLVNPAAAEICGNGVDDNCSGAQDEGFPDVNGDGVAECVPFGTGSDSDGDGVVDADDNCPFLPNPGQADADGDGIGDACDLGCPPVCNDGNPCTTDSCNPATFNCQFVPNSAACSDGDACTVGDACVAGACVPGQAEDCDDGDACTDDACDKLLGCTALVNTGGCDDGDPCTLVDTCVAGECIGVGAPTCDDGNPCTADTCNGDTGACEHLDLAVACDDANACTEGDFCSVGACLPGPAQDCDDGNPCTSDVCDKTTGACVNLPIAAGCDDGNSCTADDACVAGACVGGPNGCACAEDGDCAVKEDGDACNGTLICKLNECVVDPLTLVSCAVSSTPCQKNVCVPATGLCALSPVPDSAGCDDGDGCTLGDTCAAGTCVAGAAASCDDGNACTDDSCDPVTGLCAHAPNTAACDDGNACTTGDTCGASVCVGLVPVDCDDGNPCTTDSCLSLSGCIHAPNALPCDDGAACTVGDGCAAGSCASGGNVCQCQGTLDCAAFEDGNLCNGTLVCADNQCVVDPLSPVVCGQAPPCQANMCEPSSGECVALAMGDGTPCDDGDGCTVGDVCGLGVCVGGGPLDCGEGGSCAGGVCSGGALATCRDLALCYFACGLPGAPDNCNSDCEAAALPSATAELGVFIDCLDAACLVDPSPGCDHPNNPVCAVQLASCLQCETDDQCDYGNTCANAVCTVGGSCDVSPIGDGTQCDDGDACTADDSCLAGECVASPGLDCDDGNLCTAEVCDGLGGCVSTAVEGCNPTDDLDFDDSTADVDCDDGDATVYPGAPELCDGQDNDCDGAAEGLVGTDCAVGEVCIEAGCVDVAVECASVDACVAVCGGDSVCAEACVSAASPAYQAARQGLSECLDASCPTGDEGNCYSVAIGGPCAGWAVCGEGACVPDCAGKTCGDDGCGQECGVCQPEDVCIAFQCGAPECFNETDCLPGEFCNGGVCRDLNCPEGCPGGQVCAPGGCVDPTPCLGDGDCATADSCLEATCVGNFCQFSPVNCDDGNPCTVDSCDGSGAAALCVNAAVPTGVSCELVSSCAAPFGICSLGSCLPVEPVVCNDGDLCTVDGCQEGVGCVFEPLCAGGEVCFGDGRCLVAGAGCTLDAQCATGDPCVQGQCFQNVCVELSYCDDNNPCTDDLCSLSPGLTCDYQTSTLNGSACNVGASGCGGFVCDSGSCVEDVGAPPPCPDDGDVCTIAQCFGAGACGYVSIACDDGDPCTTDSCDPISGCASTPVDCGAGALCHLGGCVPEIPCGTVAECPAPVDACEVYACEGSLCLPSPLGCDDANPCTQDFCDPGSPLSPCQHPARPFASGCGGACEFGFCVAGVCSGLTPVGCSDGDPCTLDSCDAGSGNCTFTPVCSGDDVCLGGQCYAGPSCADASGCDDGDPCTQDICHESVCVNLPQCDDGNPCTADSCLLGACTFDPTPMEAAGCDTGSACLTGACVLGACLPAAPVTCPDDGNLCTVAQCHPELGCVVQPADCAGDPCEVADCNPVTGCSATPIDCGVEAACFQGGCYFSPPCADVSDCPPPPDACSTFACIGESCVLVAVACDDLDPCTDDYCDGGLGCQNVPLNCEPGYTCNAGTCECVPDCAGKQCGDDGCGGACGVCAEGDVCNDGLCFAQ
ncbi:MAG: hypothetical protein R3F39_08930 [Myxococcota bacterium]